MSIDRYLAELGMVGEPIPAASDKTFPDDAHFRIEIPSVEGPAVLEAVLAAAAKEGITVNRVSQGSGAMLLSRSELRDMAAIGREAGLEVSLFIGPREEFDIGNHNRAHGGSAIASQARSLRQLRYAIDDVERAVEEGIRGFLVADIGLLDLLGQVQDRGDLPASVVWKASVAIAPSNPAAFRVLQRLGASTINVPSDVTLGQLYEFRASSALPIDLYVESSDSLGGVVRGHEASELISVGSPMYVKFGLRNAPALYPSGAHLVSEATLAATEKVHRAAVALEWLDRSGVNLLQSKPGATGLGIPESRPAAPEEGHGAQ